MADFSLTTLFVVPVGQTTVPSSGSTQDLDPGIVGIFKSNYAVATALNIATNNPYFYIAQGRENTYLQASKRSDKISSTGANVTEWYKVTGCATAYNQITDVTNFSAQCGDVITLTLRADSSYLRTLYFNGFTRSVTIQAPCCDCGSDPCTDVDADALIDQLIAKLTAQAPGINPDNISLNKFYTFARVGTGPSAILRITGKPLTQYGQPCDIAAFPFEYDRMSFRTFVYAGPATTADFIVADSCNIVADATITQRASYASGQAAEFIQLEKNFYSYQAGYLKHLYRMNGYNENFESYVSAGKTYDSYYIKFNEYDKSAYQWGDYIQEDSTVIIAAPQTDGNGAPNPVGGLIETILEAALGTLTGNNNCSVSNVDIP